ncbi:MAG: CvpA family protein [Bacteroidaceae bacterium]|nr:CvpA family protein [Bacteroidaceae bacterium]
MNTLDIALTIIILAGFIYGYFKGLIKQLSFGAGIILGLLQAVMFYPAAAVWIKSHTQWNDWIAIPAAFIAILVCTIIIFKLAGIILAGILKLCHLSFIDNALGSIFSTIVATFLFVGGVELVEYIAPNKYTGETSQKESLLYKHTKILTSLIIVEAEKNI